MKQGYYTSMKALKKEAKKKGYTIEPAFPKVPQPGKFVKGYARIGTSNIFQNKMGQYFEKKGKKMVRVSDI